MINGITLVPQKSGLLDKVLGNLQQTCLRQHLPHLQYLPMETSMLDTWQEAGQETGIQRIFLD